MAKPGCAKLEGSSFVGTSCAGGFAVFGPYASVAAGSDVTLSFSFTPSEDVAFSTEIVSETGKIVHAALGSQHVRKNEAARVSVRTQPQLDTKSLEARIVIYTEKPINYVIGDFSLSVR